MVSRLEELLSTEAPSWPQLFRASARACVLPKVLGRAPTICTGMCGVWEELEEEEGGAGRIGGGFRDGRVRGSLSPCRVLGWIGTGPFPDFSEEEEDFCRGCREWS